MFDLSGKVAVVTGAGSGIGQGIALKLAEAGADIVASVLYLDRAKETANLVRKIGRQSQAAGTVCLSASRDRPRLTANRSTERQDR